MATDKPRIVNKSEARRKEDSKIKSSIDRKNNAKKNRAAKTAIEQRERQKAAGIVRVGGSPLTPTEPTPIRPGTITGEAAPYNPPGQSRFETMVHEQSVKGYSQTNGYQMSDTSRGIYNKAHEYAETIRTGVQTEQFNKIPGSQVLGYPVRSTANLVDVAGMIPGGVETLADNPKVIVPALTVGAYQSTAGTAQAFKEEPLQTSSDIITGALLTGGAVKAAPKITGAVGSGVKIVSTNTKPFISTTLKPAVKWTFADEIAFAAKHTPKVKNMANRVLFDAEMVKLQGKQGFDVAGSKISQGTNKLTSKLPTEQVNQGINRVLFDAEMVKLQGKQGFDVAGSKISQGTNKLTSKLPTEQVRGTANRVLFDAEMVKLQGKQGFDVAGSKISQGTNKLTSKLPTEQVNQGINRVLFDAEMVKLHQKNSIKRMLIEERGEVTIQRQIQPELSIQPKIKAATAQTVKPAVQSKGFFNPSIFAPGVVSANVQIPSTKQRQEQIQIPDFAMDQLTVQIQDPVQVKIQVQKSIQIKDSIPKLSQKTIFSNGFGGVSKMPTLPRAAPKNKNIDIPDLSGWGKRQKSHYVADPKSIL